MIYATFFTPLLMNLGRISQLLRVPSTKYNQIVEHVHCTMPIVIPDHQLISTSSRKIGMIHTPLASEYNNPTAIQLHCNQMDLSSNE